MKTTEQESLALSSALKEFRKEFPGINSGDMQTFIIGFQKGHKAGMAVEVDNEVYPDSLKDFDDKHGTTFGMK